MTISDEMVERAAKVALTYLIDSYGKRVPDWGTIRETDRKATKSMVNAILTAALQGSVVVPAEPTTKMFGAFISATLAIDHTDLPAGAFEAFCVDYRAMLAAAPSVTRHDGETPLCTWCNGPCECGDAEETP
ncbi:MAG: hypothetical protein V4477_17080 [Pseudomonadota bacterium]